MSLPRALTAALLLTAACGPTVYEDVGQTGPEMSFEEFEAATYHEPWEYGVYIVNGDTPIVDHKALREFYDELYGGGELIVHQVGGVDAKWSDAQKVNLTYCISDAFAGNTNAMIAAMTAATDNGWETAANINFVHLADQDSNCTAENQNVVFDVRPVSGQPYLARAFFPNQTRETRNVLVDSAAFNTSWPLSNILIHELGHALGFRHEHTRPESGQCFEDSNWRPLTPYDSASTMHYPQCNGSSDDLALTQTDKDGAAALYGAPGDPDPDPDPDPDGIPMSDTVTGSVAAGQTVHFKRIKVVAGSELSVAMSGTGDPDLYVRFGRRPTLTRWDCRPYLDGPNETCTLTVPAGQSYAHVMVYGYAAGTFSIDRDWVAPAP
jgi:serine protease